MFGGFEVWLVEEYVVFLIVVEIGFKGVVCRDFEGKEGLVMLMFLLFNEGVGEFDL